jgi:hypothetical protein
VHEYFYPVSQRIHEMLCGVEIETDQVHYRITTEGRDRTAERSIALGGVAIERYMLYGLPFGGVVIGPPRSAGNGDYVVALVNEPRHEPRANVSRRSNDYGAQLATSMSSKASCALRNCFGWPEKQKT